MANQIHSTEMPAIKDSRSGIEVEIDNQAAVIEDLEISINMLAKAVDFLLAPVSVSMQSAGSQLEPVAPAASRAIENVRAHNQTLRRLGEHIEELKNRITL